VGVFNESRDGVITVTGPVTSFNTGYTENIVWVTDTSSNESQDSVWTDALRSERSSSGYCVTEEGESQSSQQSCGIVDVSVKRDHLVSLHQDFDPDNLTSRMSWRLVY